MELLPIRGVFGRDEIGREDEAEDGARGQLLAGEEPPQQIAIRERGTTLLVDVRRGQKTGLFLDQRENRNALRRFSRGRTVLNCYSYTGGFSVNAAMAGATSVTSIDQDTDAIALSREVFTANEIDPAKHEFLVGDVPDFLSEARRSGRRFGCIVLDPPAFTKSQKTVESAQEGYAGINRAAFQLLEPGGGSPDQRPAARASPLKRVLSGCEGRGVQGQWPKRPTAGDALSGPPITRSAAATRGALPEIARASDGCSEPEILAANWAGSYDAAMQRRTFLKRGLLGGALLALGGGATLAVLSGPLSLLGA